MKEVEKLKKELEQVAKLTKIKEGELRKEMSIFYDTQQELRNQIKDLSPKPTVEKVSVNHYSGMSSEFKLHMSNGETHSVLNVEDWDDNLGEFMTDEIMIKCITAAKNILEEHYIQKTQKND